MLLVSLRASLWIETGLASKCRSAGRQRLLIRPWEMAANRRRACYLIMLATPRHSSLPSQLRRSFSGGPVRTSQELDPGSVQAIICAVALHSSVLIHSANSSRTPRPSRRNHAQGLPAAPGLAAAPLRAGISWLEENGHPDGAGDHLALALSSVRSASMRWPRSHGGTQP